jgi:NSS family neurotransmitter:Na+ symporter
MAQSRDFWSGRTGFVLATIGAAVGLGSIWKFPYEVGANGGGAFLLLYLAGLAFIVFPLMLVEFAIGRRGRADAAYAIIAVAAAAGASRRWGLCGLLGVAAAFIILSYYSVIGGWAIAYAVDTALQGLGGADVRAVQARFDSLLAAPLTMTAYHLVFMAAVAFIVAGGVSKGIEAACKILMPILIGLIVVLGLFSMTQGDLAATWRFLFSIDPAHMSLRVALDAVGLGFFSIGVGFSLMITYAAYAGAEVDLREVAIVTILGDTAVSVAAGFAVFPIVFAEGLNPAAGSGLMFVTLPLAFAKIPGGTIAAVGFFVLLVVAAVASGLSMMEMPVAMLTHRGWSRRRATVAAAAAIWLCGLPTVLSFNYWATWHPLAAVPLFAEATVFDLLDHLTSNMMLPIGGISLALFAGWTLPPQLLADEIGIGPRAARLLRFLLRYIVPTCVAVLALFPLVG